jgi:hypothetical protein
MAHSKKHKGQSRRRRTYKRSYSRYKQKGGAIITPATYSNSNNAHFSGFGFTDPRGTLTGCTGGGAGNIYTTIGGVRTPINMKGGSRKISCAACNRCKCVCKNKSKMRRRRRMQRGGNTNGYSIGGVHLNSNLSGIANNYHTPFDSCKG